MHFKIKGYFCFKISKMTVEIYKALRDRLRGTFPNDGVDMYLEQYTDTGGGSWLWGNDSFFIEFLPLQWDTLGNAVQGGTLDFIIHHVTFTGYDDERRMVAANSTHFLKNADLTGALHGWGCTLAFIGINSTNQLINSVTRVSSEMVASLGSLIISRLRFRAYVMDYSAVKEYAAVLAAIRVKIFLAQNNADNDDSESTTIELPSEA